MKEIEFKIIITLKDLNQALALMGQDILTTEDEIKEYEGLSFDTSTLGKDLQAKVGIAAILFAAKLGKK